MRSSMGRRRISRSACLPENGHGTLRIENDGISPAAGHCLSGSGMGMQIMNYRARMIGGSLKVESGGRAGSASLPVSRRLKQGRTEQG